MQRANSSVTRTSRRRVISAAAIVRKEPIDEEEGGGSCDEGTGSATSEFGFAAKVDALLSVIGIIKFPVNVLAALTDDGKLAASSALVASEKKSPVSKRCATSAARCSAYCETIIAVVPVSGIGDGVILWLGAMIESLKSHMAPWVQERMEFWLFGEEHAGGSGRVGENGDDNLYFFVHRLENCAATKGPYQIATRFERGGEYSGCRFFSFACHTENNVRSCFHGLPPLNYSMRCQGTPQLVYFVVFCPHHT